MVICVAQCVNLDMARIDMLRGYNNMKERAAQDTDQSTRSIYACGVETMSDSSLVQLPNADSIKSYIEVVMKDHLTQHLLLELKFSKDLKLPQRVNPFYFTIPDLEILIE